MKNSYRIYPVYGTSALKYEEMPRFDRTNIVEFPTGVRVKQNQSNRLRIQRDVPKPSFKAKVDMVLSFVVCYSFCLGVIISMV